MKNKDTEESIIVHVHYGLKP